MSKVLQLFALILVSIFIIESQNNWYDDSTKDIQDRIAEYSSSLD